MSARGVRRIGIYGGGVFFGIMSVAQPFFTLYAEGLGAPTATIGLLVTLRALLPMLIAMPIGQMIDTLGPLQMTKIGSLLMIVSLAITASSQTLFLLGISQVILGASMIIVASSLQVLASDGETDKAQRNHNINRYSMWGSAGSMVGPILGGILVSSLGSSLFSYRAAFLLSMTVAIISYLIVLYVSRDQKRTQGTFQETKDLFKPKAILQSYVSGIHLTRHRGVQFGLMGTFMIMFIQALYTSFIPLYLNSSGYSAIIISTVVSLTGLAGLTSRFLLDRFTKRTTLEKILISAGCLASACLILIPVASLHVIGICILTFVLGSAVGINLPVSIMIMVDDTLDNERGKVMGLRLLMNRFSQMLSPALFGLLGQTLGLTAAFYTGGGLLFASMLGFAVFSSAKLSEPAVPGSNIAE